MELRNVSAAIELKNHGEQGHAANCSRLAVVNRRITLTGNLADPNSISVIDSIAMSAPTPE